jgi:carbon starvation protein
VAVTLTASWYKIFSSDPLIGFFAQRDKYQQALDAGEVIPPAKSLDDVSQIVTNSTVDGVLSSLFAGLIIVIIADAARIWWHTLSGRREPVLAEAPVEESKLWAPSGLFPTVEDRARQAEQQAEPVGAGRERSGGAGDRGPGGSGDDG